LRELEETLWDLLALSEHADSYMLKHSPTRLAPNAAPCLKVRP
jgi:hypothetical protein